jgi:two-component system, cell cycle sensor histidine kinase and response regulator CckA
MNLSPPPEEASQAQKQALRDRAEEKSRSIAQLQPDTMGPEETKRLLHELRVHQIELEMQNEELRAAQIELDVARSRYFDLYELAPVGYCTVSKTGLILEANLTLATLLGVTRGVLVKQPLASFILKEDQEIYYRHRKVLFETGQSQVCELRLMKKEDAPFWARLEAIPSRDTGGAPVCRVAISDITERKQTEAHLQQAQKLESIGTLAGGIAHDFNNILYPLLGFTELLKEDIPVDSPLQEHIDEILHATLRLRDLVRQILAFSRKGDQTDRPIQLHPIVKEALKLLRASIPTTIDIHQDIDSDGGVVMADPTQIHQIVMNLVTNAFHAMEDAGGILKVSLKPVALAPESAPSITNNVTPGAYVLLTISDTGTGIAEDILDKIFEPYFTTKGVGKGTGLGLSVVYGIVKAYKGGIHISSEPGKGTEVRVYLPIMEKTAEENRIEDGEPLPGGTEKILLIDDEEVIVHMERQLLERLGYRVDERTSSVDALGVFKANPADFDLVLTDMTMPRLTGIQLAEKLLSFRPDIPIIICTGFSENISDEKSKLFGIKGFLMKPVVQSDMAQMVRKVLDEAKG